MAVPVSILLSKFVDRNDITPYSRRDSANTLVVPLPRTKYFRNSFLLQRCSSLEQSAHVCPLMSGKQRNSD